MNSDRRQLLHTLLETGLAAVSGRDCVVRALAARPVQGPVRAVAVGKAADAMMRGALSVLGEQLVAALVIPKAGARAHPLTADHRLRVLPAAHPVPDASSLAAGQALLQFVCALQPGECLLVMVSGGASSLVEVPAPGVGLAALAGLNQALLASGLDIHQCNRVRARYSRIKAGGLLHFVTAGRVLGLLISDVPGDDPAVIGSGLLSPRADTTLPEGLPPALAAGAPPGRSPVVPTVPVTVQVVATNAMARQAIAARARDLGVPVRQADGELTGDAAVMGEGIARQLAGAVPGLYLWGGETTVNLPLEPGQGGRNQHLALAAARVLEGRHGVSLVACGTDGNDGTGDWAGAVVDGGTVSRGRAAGLDPARCLAAADAGRFLAAAGDRLRTGPTGTNVSDLVLGLVTAPGGDMG